MLKVAAENTNIGEILKQLEVFNEYRDLFNQRRPVTDVLLDSDGIPCYHYTQIAEINSHPSLTIFVDLISEGIHSINFLKQYRTDKHYVIFSNGWWDTEYYNIGINYTLVPWNIFLFDYSTQISTAKSINYFTKDSYNYDSAKQQLFCSLIGSRRPPRDAIVGKIQKLENIEYILNYNSKELKNSSRNSDICYDFSCYNSYKNFGKTSDYTISHSIPIDIYNSSNFNLVVETTVLQLNEFHLTEKTIKPIISGIPFVLIAGPHYLQRLRNLGFKTFHTLWSEEYDNIENFDDRVDTIVNLIESLKDFDWKTHASELKEIANHNKINLMYNNTLLKSQLIHLENVLLNLSNKSN